MTENQTSMFYWFPRIEGIAVPYPKTLMYRFSEETLRHLEKEEYIFPMKEIEDIARRIGWPLFMRTDHAAGKHDWEKTCYVPNPEFMYLHVYELIVANQTADVFGGVPFTGLAFREYIPMASVFHAFWGNLPINPERRYFIRDGKVQCHHPYWPPESIRRPSVENWRELLSKANEETPLEIALLTAYSEIIGERLDGYWSLDFCLARDGRWIFIDAALGDKSFHWEGCNAKPY